MTMLSTGPPVLSVRVVQAPLLACVRRQLTCFLETWEVKKQNANANVQCSCGRCGRRHSLARAKTLNGLRSMRPHVTAFQLVSVSLEFTTSCKIGCVLRARQRKGLMMVLNV